MPFSAAEATNRRAKSPPTNRTRTGSSAALARRSSAHPAPKPSSGTGYGITRTFPAHPGSSATRSSAAQREVETIAEAARKTRRSRAAGRW